METERIYTTAFDAAFSLAWLRYNVKALVRPLHEGQP